MTDTNCRDISDLLVDYADGDLPEGSASRVAAHLQDCAACRRELGALSASLTLVQTQWREIPVHSRLSLRERTSFRGAKDDKLVNGSVPVVAARPQRSTKSGMSLSMLAAGLLVAICGGGVWWFVFQPRPFAPIAELSSDVPVAGSGESGPAELSSADLAAIEAQLNQESSAARLVASANVLANQPGAEEYAARSLRFVVEVYPHTQAGREAARQLSRLAPDDSATLPN